MQGGGGGAAKGRSARGGYVPGQDSVRGHTVSAGQGVSWGHNRVPGRLALSWDAVVSQEGGCPQTRAVLGRSGRPRTELRGAVFQMRDVKVDFCDTLGIRRRDNASASCRAGP